MSHPPERPRRSSWLQATLRGLRWFLRQFMGSAAGTAHFEHVFVAAACAFCGLIAFKHYGVALESHERLQAVRINSPQLPSSEEYASSLGVGVDPEDFPRCSLAGGCPGDGQCFAAGTLVSTEAGLRAIEQIHEGDRVWARDVETGTLALKPVSHTFVRSAAPVIDLELTGPGLGSERLSVTPSHRFWVEGQGWQRADALAGTSVWSPESPFFATALTSREQTTTVYNFEVEEFHSYFVGESRVLVHNDCNDEDDPDNRAERDEEARPGKPIHPKCFNRRSNKGLDGFEPRRVYDEDEVKDDPRFDKHKDEEGRDYWLPNDKLKREMMRYEEDRQLAAQQAELERMTVDEYLQSRKEWKDRLNTRREAWKLAGKKGTRPHGRPSNDGQALNAERDAVIDALFDHYMMEALAGIEGPTEDQIEKAAAAANEAIERDIGGTNPLHKLDGSAGGDGTMHGLGNGAVNQYIGSQWPGRTRAIEKEAEAMQRAGEGSRLMNVELRYCD
jgi:hypothetical protein